MKQDYIGFFNRSNKLLGAISVKGATISELKPTRDLLAYNHKIRPSSIHLKIVKR